jgi:predicted nucleic acid-binding protein
MIRPDGIVVDAGPLVYLAARERLADQHKKTQKFGSNGYKVSVKLVSNYGQLIVTPHSLTEAWNLTGSDDASHTISRDMKKNLMNIIQTAVEVYESVASLQNNDRFLDLGIADAAQLNAAKINKLPLFTVDRKLCGIARKKGIEAYLLDDLIEARSSLSLVRPKVRRR